MHSSLLPLTHNQHPAPRLSQQACGLWQLCFDAMASPCEVLLDAPHLRADTISALCQNLVRETWRIEHQYSRYQPNNIIHAINHAQGAPVELDTETQHLIQFADTCFHLSDGLFDITSGILRRAWSFNVPHTIPTQQQIEQLLPLIGWQKCRWQPPYLQLPAGAEIDLGGLGKEYAADKALALLQQGAQQNPQPANTPSAAFLVNFGGDIAASGPRPNQTAWQVGLAGNPTDKHIALTSGGIATSGDTHRFIYHEGTKLSHILNPKTGWPITGGPSTVTVIASNCVQAGMLATFALLQGAGAEDFLRQQNCSYLVV
ncbi:MAG: hypothetical protein RL497_906 [Pseudomonadota bacterium]|jgi:thiamine biosynthesis lipoprotein